MLGKMIWLKLFDRISAMYPYVLILFSFTWITVWAEALQRFQVTHKSSTDYHECNDNTKTIASFEQVVFEPLETPGPKCVCSFNVSTSTTIDDSFTVLTIQTDQQFPILYDQFARCGGTLFLDIQTLTSNRSVQLRCDQGYLQNSFADEAKSVLVIKSPLFNGDVGMTCEEEPEESAGNKHDATKSAGYIGVIISVIAAIVTVVGLIHTLTLIKCNRKDRQNIYHDGETDESTGIENRQTLARQYASLELSPVEFPQRTEYTNLELNRTGDYENVEDMRNTYVNETMVV